MNTHPSFPDRTLEDYWDDYPDANSLALHPTNTRQIMVDGIARWKDTREPVRPVKPTPPARGVGSKNRPLVNANGSRIQTRTWARFPNAKDIRSHPIRSNWLIIDGVITDRDSGKPVKDHLKAKVAQ